MKPLIIVIGIIVLVLVVLMVNVNAEKRKYPVLDRIVGEFIHLPQRAFLNKANGVLTVQFADKAMLYVDTIAKEPLLFLYNDNGTSKILWINPNIDRLEKAIKSRLKVQERRSDETLLQIKACKKLYVLYQVAV